MPCLRAGGVVLEDTPCKLCQGASAVPLAEVTAWHFEQAKRANEKGEKA